MEQIYIQIIIIWFLWNIFLLFADEKVWFHSNNIWVYKSHKNKQAMEMDAAFYENQSAWNVCSTGRYKEVS